MDMQEEIQILIFFIRRDSDTYFFFSVLISKDVIRQGMLEVCH